MAIDPDALASVLMADEGFRGRPYTDTTGHVTIGYGRNLTAKPLTKDEAYALLRHDIEDTLADLDRLLQWWRNLDDVRQGVLANMAFNMGAFALCGFRKMLTALQAKDYATAAKEMRDSAWFPQVGSRAQRLARQMETGQP